MTFDFKAKSVTVERAGSYDREVSVSVDADLGDLIEGVGLDVALEGFETDAILNVIGKDEALNEIGEEYVMKHFGLVKPEGA